MVAVLKRLGRAALTLFALLPLIAAAHGNHTPPNRDGEGAPAAHREANASARTPVAVAPAPCPTGDGRACGCHGVSCTRLGEPDIIATVPAAFGLRWVLDAALPFSIATLPLPSKPATPFTPRAPPVTS